MTTYQDLRTQLIALERDGRIGPVDEISRAALSRMASEGSKPLYVETVPEGFNLVTHWRQLQIEAEELRTATPGCSKIIDKWLFQLFKQR